MKYIYHFSIFQIIFFTCMWASKTLHPLFFEQTQNMQNFSFAYSAMALSGYFSFIIGHYCDRLGYRVTLALGCLIYGASLTLRIFPDSTVVSIVSGLIGGIGASAALSSIRVWMMEISDESNRSRFVGIKNSMTALGTAIGCSLAGMLSGNIFNVGLQTLLKFSGVGMILVGMTSLLLPKAKTVVRSASGKHAGMISVFRDHRYVAIGTMSLGVFAGFYVSFISPYLPVILKSKGFDLTAVGLSTGALALIRFFVDPLIGKWMEDKKEKSFQLYIMAEIFVLLATAAFLSPFNQHSFIIFLILRSLGLGFTMIAEEITWLRIFPKESLGLCFGLNQSGFFIGDFFGGLINGKIFTSYGMEGCATAALVIMVLNITVFALFMSKVRRRSVSFKEALC